MLGVARNQHEAQHAPGPQKRICAGDFARFSKLPHITAKEYMSYSLNS